jgi:hypothetical protein
VNASVIFQLPLAAPPPTRASRSTAGQWIRATVRPPSFKWPALEYFRTMGIPLVEGREFTDRDDLSSPPVLIINEALARQYFPNEDPIGKRIAPGFSTVPVRMTTTPACGK